jgi:hypothetical protein
MSLDECPEPPRVVWNTQVTELVHDHVVEHLERREYEPPVEGERAAGRARAPKSALPSDTDSAVLDPDALALLVGQRQDELSRGRTRLRLADRGRVEAESRYLAHSLFDDPRPFLLEQALHIGVNRPSWHSQPRRLSPRHLQPPSPRLRRPPHLDLLQPRTSLAVDSGGHELVSIRARSSSSWRSSIRRIFPVSVFGSSLTNSTRRGYAYAERRSRT